MPELNEAELVQRARGGEDEAWHSIVRLHQDPIFRLAYLLLGDPQDAQDVAQETFIRAMKSISRFDESRPLRPWLLRIASNLARNRRRSIGRYWRALQRAARLEPEQPHTSGDDARLLWQAIRNLKHDDQQILYLRYFLAMSERETAQALGIAPGTVKSRLHRSLGRLRAVVERNYPELAPRGISE